MHRPDKIRCYCQIILTGKDNAVIITHNRKTMNSEVQRIAVVLETWRQLT